MTRSDTHSRRRSEGLAGLLLALTLAAGGCITQAKHDRIVGALEDEKSQLQTRVSDLERSNKSLDDERLQLIDQMEDLRETRAALSQDVEKLTRSKDLLTEHLRKRESEVAELSQLHGTYKGLVSELESEVAAGQIQIEQLRDGIRLNLPQAILFPSGSAQLDPKGETVLRKVASKLKEQDHRIEVQGHTDNVPISGALAQRFASNWELAAARAARVVRLFQDAKIDTSRLSAISYGEFAPVASNDTAEGREKNRRIEIRLRPVDAPQQPEGSDAAAANAAGAGTPLPTPAGRAAASSESAPAAQ